MIFQFSENIKAIRWGIFYYPKTYYNGQFNPLNEGTRVKKLMGLWHLVFDPKNYCGKYVHRTCIKSGGCHTWIIWWFNGYHWNEKTYTAGSYHSPTLIIENGDILGCYSDAEIGEEIKMMISTGSNLTDKLLVFSSPSTSNFEHTCCPSPEIILKADLQNYPNDADMTNLLSLDSIIPHHAKESKLKRWNEKVRKLKDTEVNIMLYKVRD